MATRPLEFEEYKAIIKLMMNGFVYSDNLNVDKLFRPNIPIALALQLQSTLGLRIGDVLKLKVSNLKNGKLELREDKTDKLQYREINPEVYNYILDYALENKLGKDQQLFKIGVRAVQKQLKIVTKYLGLENIATHSFRKMYAVAIYENSDSNIYLLKELLNHTNLSTTQRYIRVSQQELDKASKEINFIVETDEIGNEYKQYKI